uniref:Polycystic kidney disease 1 like 2a n=1 Tax=Gouania willdenowi TaxID=441366 RepID=A0A8C5HFB0_GOUWI
FCNHDIMFLGTWAALLMLLILIPLSCENEISPARCQKSQKAFRDSCFEFPALQLSFFRAQTWCEERRGHLVFITDEDTQSFLQRHLDPGTDVWIGLISSIDSSNKGGHGWLDGSPVGFSKWMDDDDLALNATCGRILGRSEYQWGATSDCTQTLPFICQFESGRAIVCADYNATLQCDPGRVVMIGSSFYGRNSLYYCRSAVPPPVTLTPPCSSWVDVTQATAGKIIVIPLQMNTCTLVTDLSEKNITHRYTHQSTFTMTANCTHAEVSISAQEVIAVEEPVTEVEVIMCYAGNQSFTANNCTALHGAQLLLQMELKSGSCQNDANAYTVILKGNISLSSLYVFNENVPQNMTVSEEKVKQLGPGCHNLTLSASNHITSSRVSRDFQVTQFVQIERLKKTLKIIHIVQKVTFSFQVRDSNTDFSSVDDLRRMIEEVVTLLKEQSQLSGATLGQLFDSVAKKMNSQLYESQKSDVEKVQERYTWLVPPESLHGRIGPHSLLIRPIVGNGIKSITGSLSVTAITASCKYWVPSLLDWSNEGCRVGYNTSSSSVHCLCNHLTTFGGSFFVTPNLVDPSRSAELFATFADNPVVVCFVMALVILYFLVLVWARWKDVKDTSKVNVTVLRDNNPLDRYYYLLSVKTGHRIGASTSSQVTITLLGAETNSEPHHLTDAKKQVFQRGAMDMFLLSTPFSLGNLQAIRMWHNNSGNSPDWFVSSVSVQDLQTKQKWYFLCNCWLSVDQDDCALDKVIPLPTELELKKFSHLFFLRTTRDFSDGHLWLSVVARPPSSTFTCVQRVSCCFSLLLCTMLTSIMFYGIPTDPSEQTLDLGHFEFTWQQFMVGVQSSLIMFPVNILIVGIFRWTRPRETPCCQRKKKKPKTTLEEVINSSHTAAINTKANITVDTFIMDITRLSRSLSETLQINSEFEPEETNDINAILSVMEDAVQQNYKTKNSVVLHPVMVEGTEKKTQYVFDQLCHIEEELVLLGPENFPTANSYSQAVEQVHGMKKLLENQLSEEENLSTAAEQSNVDEKKKKKKCCAGGLPWWFVFFGWLLVLATSSVSAYFTMLYGLKFGKERSISWLVSLVVSFFQSLLLIQPLKVICFAVFFALVIKKVDDEDDHEDAHALRRVAGIYEPPPMSDIERMKRNRILEQKAFALFWEIITYLCFMWMLLLVAYGQRDPNAYFLNQHIRKSFSGNTLNSLSISDVFTWANTSLIDNLFGVYPGFITDGNSKLVGNARLRQLRVQKNSCKISSYMNQLVSDCHAPYSWDTEDTGFYEPGWHRIVTDNSTSSSTNCSSSTSSSPWTYQTQEQLRSHPTWGRLGVYRGGGFVVELGPDLTNASRLHLFSSKWLDTYTRALIVEFTVYNANVNLFCMVTLMLETAAVGVFQFHNELQSIRLYQSTSGLPIFVMAAEIIYLLFVLYYMFLQGKLMRTQRWMYFKNMWNLLELSIIMLTWSAVAVFIIRTVFGNRDLDYYQNHKDKFASFYQTASADCVLNYLIAFIVLLSTVKLWRLLRLNSKMNMLTATLQRASGDIFSFLVVIIVMLIAYSFTSNVLYGWKISSYKTLFDAVMTIICLQVGMFNYSEVLDNTSLLGGLLFGSCVIFMTYVVLNLFISVILVAFNEEQIHHKVIFHVVFLLLMRLVLKTRSRCRG